MSKNKCEKLPFGVSKTCFGYYSARFGHTKEVPVMPEKTEFQLMLESYLYDIDKELDIYGTDKKSGLSAQQVATCKSFLSYIKSTIQ